MGKSSGGGSSTTVQKADPWIGQQPALSSLYAGAVNQYNSGGPNYYPNSTVAPLSPITQQAQQMLYRRATQGNFLNNVAQGQAQRTLGDYYLNNSPTMPALSFIGQGGMLGSNPYLDATFNQAANNVGRQFRTNVMPGVTSMFAGAGRFGSNQMGTALDNAQQDYGNTLNNLATGIYGGSYQNERALQQQALSEMGTQIGRERTLQMGALGSAPMLANQDYFDINQLGQLGGAMDQYNQGLLGADVNRYNYYQTLPEHNLQVLNQLVTGNNPWGTTAKQDNSTVPRSPLAGAAGGALLGNSIGSALGYAGPWGALGGAVLGGLLA